MAVNLNKQLTIKDLNPKKLFAKKGDGVASSDLPSKTTMNLYQPYARQGAKSPSTLILLGVLVALLIGAFVKFGVLDQFARVNEARAQLASTQEQLTAIQAQLGNMDEMEAEYAKYSNNYLNAVVSVADVLDLTDTYVKPYASVQNISLSDGTLTYTLTGVSLDVVGDIVTRVKGYPLAENVSVSTATSDEDPALVTAQMTVKFVTEKKEDTGDYKQSDLFSGLDTNGHDVLANTRG